MRAISSKDSIGRFRQNPVWIRTEGGIVDSTADPHVHVMQRFKMMADAAGC
jgi:hypothetical protein